MANYKLVTLLFITILCGCQKSTESFKPKDSSNSTEITSQSNKENIETNVNNSTENKEENICCSGDIKDFLVKELDEPWQTKSGENYHLNQTSKKKLLSKLLTIGKKQYDLSYYAKNEELSEEISEVNVTKIITTDENGFTSVRKIYSQGKGEKKLAIAKDNVRKSADNLCKNTNNLEFVVEESRVEKVNLQTCEFNVNNILLKIHKDAIQDIEEMLGSLRNKNERRF